MTRLKRALSYLFALAAVLLASVQSGAQIPQPRRSASEVLANFQKLARTRMGSYPEEVRHPEKFASARVDSILDGLEQIALTAEPRFTGSVAAAALAYAGSVEKAPPGVFDRAVRVYTKSKHPIVRLKILNRMFQQKEGSRSLAFLKSVAVQRTDQQDFQDAASAAAEGLSRMGADGLAALVELQDRKLLRDGNAIGFVRWFLTTTCTKGTPCAGPAAPIAAVPPNAAAQTLTKCRPADSYTEVLIGTLKADVSSTDPRVVFRRDSTYHIPVVSPSRITLVTDEKICAKIIQAYAALPNGAYTPARVYVIKLGSKGYAALDPDRKAGEFSIFHIFNTKYVDVGGWVGG